MATIISYLTFDGNCREAMTFYKDCFGGDLMLQQVKGSPMADKMPKEMKECILHSTLKTQGFVLMGSDMTPETGLVKGNSTSLMLDFNSEEEIKRNFDKLSNGGAIKHRLEKTFWGALFGEFTDKFGNNWMLNFDEKNHCNNTQNGKV